MVNYVLDTQYNNAELITGSRRVHLANPGVDIKGLSGTGDHANNAVDPNYSTLGFRSAFKKNSRPTLFLRNLYK